jgi:hypothetical protein
MADNVQVEAARIPDRDKLLEILVEDGLDARPVDEVEIEVRYDESGDAGDAVLAELEHIVMSLGAPFVPTKHEGVIYIRPPVS